MTLTAVAVADDPPGVDVGEVNAAGVNGHACGVVGGHGDAERGMPGFEGVAGGAVAAGPR